MEKMCSMQAYADDELKASLWTYTKSMLNLLNEHISKNRSLLFNPIKAISDIYDNENNICYIEKLQLNVNVT